MTHEQLAKRLETLASPHSGSDLHPDVHDEVMAVAAELRATASDLIPVRSMMLDAFKRGWGMSREGFNTEYSSMDDEWLDAKFEEHVLGGHHVYPCAAMPIAVEPIQYGTGRDGTPSMHSIEQLKGLGAACGRPSHHDGKHRSRGLIGVEWN